MKEMTKRIQRVKEMPLSDATASTIACLQALEEVRDTIYTVVEGFYGEALTEEVVEQILGEPFLRIKREILDLMTSIIEENMVCTLDSEVC